MLANDYADWCQLSGLYVANVSHLDRYQTYARVLSPAGLTVAIVSEFLHDANPALDVNDWRSYRVYEFGPQQAERVERTVAALKDIGATGLAEAVAASQNQSPMAALEGFLTGGFPGAASLKKLGNPFDMLQALQGALLGSGRGSSEPDSPLDVAPRQRENRQQVGELLEQFAQTHAAELQSDIERHGDPRLVPGFTVEQRKKELERLRVRWISQQTQADAIETLTKMMSKIPKLVEQKTAGKEKKAAMHLRQLVREYRENARELRRVEAADRSSETSEFLPRLEAFEQEHAALLRPDVFGNDANRQAAAAIGAFEVEPHQKSTRLTWERPDTLSCDWLQFALTVSVPAKSAAAMQAGLQTVEQLRQQFSVLQADWRQQVLSSFRDIYQGQMDEEELADYELDDQGKPSDEGILKHVTAGSITLSATDPQAREFSVGAYLNVDWDEEHGLELECDVVLGSAAEASTAAFDTADVTFQEAGPPVTAQGLAQFESTFGLTLPADYREFLLQTNGGLPSKTQVCLSMDGAEDRWNVTRFFSLSGATAEPFPAGSLERALRPHHGLKIQSCLLPIASVRQGTFPPRPISDTTLALVLTGKRAGRIILFDPEMMLPPADELVSEAEQAGVLEETVRSAWVAAPNLSALFRKLQTAPVIEIPDWLRAIREDRVEAFLAWLNSGGKLKTPFAEPGSHFQPMVVDLLAAEASPSFLATLVQKQKLTPKQLREAWQRYLFLDVQRFRELMTVLPPSDWHLAFSSPFVWDEPDLLEQLAAAHVDVNATLNDDAATALHLAVQMGRVEAVRWLMAHGADPRKKDHYGNDAFRFAEQDPGRGCLPILEGRSEPVATASPSAEAAGVAELENAASQLASGVTIRIQIEMTSPPVTRVEQLYYGEMGCHYRLTFDVGNGQVTFNDMRSPRQDYLRAKTWTEARFLPILQWPELVPQWETLQVTEFELAKAMKSRKYIPTPRPDLQAAAESTLKQSFNAEEAANRRG